MTSGVKNLFGLAETLDFVQSHPGCTTADLCRATGMSKGAVRCRVDSLIDGGFLSRRREAGSEGWIKWRLYA